MPTSNRYLRLTIGQKQIQVSDPEQLPVSIDYALEDPENFQNKSSSQALEVKVPATLLNDVAGNTFRSADIIDLTSGQAFRGNQRFVIDENGYEVMIGKAFLHSATHNGQPKEYSYDLYGDNADWKVDMEEMTLYEPLNALTFTFNRPNIIASWAYDGTDPLLPYVFAPVRYRGPMGGTSLDANNNIIPEDGNMLASYMKPSLSKYWIIFNAFKSLGYRIQSTFFDSEFFRRQVMPWTWGNFLDSDGTALDTHKFLAVSTEDSYYNSPNGRHKLFWNLNVSNDSVTPGFDPNNDYTWDSTNFEMKWLYNPPDFGPLDATFSMQVDVNARLNGTTSEIYLAVYWYKNGVQVDETALTNIGGTFSFGKSDIGIKEVFFTANVQAGDVISAKIWLSIFGAKLGFASITANVLQFKLDFFKIPLGGTINFQNYTGFKKYKFLDFFRGVIDEFNLSLNTDSVNKVLVIEPTHPYSITDDPIALNPGYFVDDFLDWNGKPDLSKEWEMENYSDYKRELAFKYKDDQNDGILKTIQDRNIIVLASGKYVFPDRFKTGKDAIENRFFAPTMHYDVDQWKDLGTGSNAGIAPQMVCMVPENVANTSNSASDNTFVPKSCYYKGLITGVGAWRFDKRILFGDNGIHQEFPYMFAVNYKAGGQDDPILSYSDEKISDGAGGFVIGKGLLKRFYWQRLAIMRNGQWYNCWFRLKNVDVAGQLHREYKSYRGQRWELIQITAYKPLLEDSTAVLLRRWAPVSVDDFNSTYPSSANVLTNNSVDPLDIKYAPLKCLTTDIPT